jgi:hypothetical protein
VAVKFRLTITVEYKDEDLKALRSLAKESGVTPKEWLEWNLLNNGRLDAQDLIWEEVRNLFEEEEGDEYFGRYVRD